MPDFVLRKFPSMQGSKSSEENNPLLFSSFPRSRPYAHGMNCENEKGDAHSKEEEERSSRYSVYILESGDRERTYVGLTNNLAKRLRQHNGLVKGGARYTSTRTGWRLACLIHGFSADSQARKLEWRMHHTHLSGKFKRPLHRRIRELDRAMSMKRWTKSCEPIQEISGLRLRMMEDVMGDLKGDVAGLGWSERVVFVAAEPSST
jgi:predicted GIY-YIG superfamily endonuclease